MLSFDNAAAIVAAPNHASLDPKIKQLLADRVHDWAVTDLLDLTHVVIVRSGDTEKDLVEQTTLSPLINPLNGSRFGLSSSYVPSFDWLQQHGQWFEIMWAFSSGHAVFAFVEDAEGSDPELLLLCRAYAAEGDQP